MKFSWLFIIINKIILYEIYQQSTLFRDWQARQGNIFLSEN